MSCCNFLFLSLFVTLVYGCEFSNNNKRQTILNNGDVVTSIVEESDTAGKAFIADIPGVDLHYGNRVVINWKNLTWDDSFKLNIDLERYRKEHGDRYLYDFFYSNFAKKSFQDIRSLNSSAGKIGPSFGEIDASVKMDYQFAFYQFTSFLKFLDSQEKDFENVLSDDALSMTVNLNMMVTSPNVKDMTATNVVVGVYLEREGRMEHFEDVEIQMEVPLGQRVSFDIRVDGIPSTVLTESFFKKGELLFFKIEDLKIKERSLGLKQLRSNVASKCSRVRVLDRDGIKDYYAVVRGDKIVDVLAKLSKDKFVITGQLIEDFHGKKSTIDKSIDIADKKNANNYFWSIFSDKRSFSLEYPAISSETLMLVHLPADSFLQIIQNDNLQIKRTAGEENHDLQLTEEKIVVKADDVVYLYMKFDGRSDWVWKKYGEFLGEIRIFKGRSLFCPMVFGEYFLREYRYELPQKIEDFSIDPLNKVVLHIASKDDVSILLKDLDVKDVQIIYSDDQIVSLKLRVSDLFKKIGFEYEDQEEIFFSVAMKNDFKKLKYGLLLRPESIPVPDLCQKFRNRSQYPHYWGNVPAHIGGNEVYGDFYENPKVEVFARVMNFKN